MLPKCPVKHTEVSSTGALLYCDENKHGIKEKQREERRNFLDLYTLGKLWLGALSIGLVGEKVSLTPSVNAAKQEGPAPKPLSSKYKDLPLYDLHGTFQELNIQKCSNDAPELTELHKFLYPHVKYFRQTICKAYNDFHSTIKENCRYARITVQQKKAEIVHTIRDPQNENLRYGVLGAGGLAGYLVGFKIRPRVVMTALGFLGAGALTFPTQTDNIFRFVMYKTRKTFQDLYNLYTGNQLKFKEKGISSGDLPPPSEKKSDLPRPCKKDKK